MGYVIYYKPIVIDMASTERDINGSRPHYTVNGATKKDRNEAIRLTSRHVGISKGNDKIVRVDEIKVWED